MDEAVKLEPELPWRPQNVGNVRVMEYLAKKTALTETSPRGRSVLQSTKLKGGRDLKNVLTSDMEMECIEFA